MTLEARARIFHALSDATRLRLVEMLAQEDELCGTQLARRAGISLSLLSHHWKVLSDAGLVLRQRRGQRQYCTVDREALANAFEFVWPQRRLQSALPA